MLSEHFNEIKTKIMRLSKIDPDLELPMKRCIRQLSKASEYERLFGNKKPQLLVDMQTGLSQNSRDIIMICLDRAKCGNTPLTTSDMNLINQKLEDSDRLINNFDAQIKQILKQN